MATYTSATIKNKTYNRGDSFVTAAGVTAYGSSDGGNGSKWIPAGTTMYFWAYSDASYSIYPYYILPSPSYQDTYGWVNADAFPEGTSSFNLNILLPDGSEPYTTGAAGSVEFSTNGGSSFSRLYNEPAASYTVGTSFVARNFTPGTGLYLSGVSGMTGSGPWYATQPTGGLTINFQTAWNTYTVSYNANGGSSTPSSQTKTYGQTLTLRGSISRSSTTGNGYTVSFNGNGGTYSGSSKTAIDTYSYSFAGWKSSASGTTYSASGSFNENNAATMTAQWNSSTSRGYVTLPAASTVSRPYYSFYKWNTNSSGTGTNYDAGFNYTPSSNTTLYATWTPNAPINLSLTHSSSTTSSITLNYSDEGVVTNRTAYYRKSGTSNYSSMAIDSGSFTISGLEPDTNYDVYFTASNDVNSSSSTVQQFSTLLTDPTINDVVSSSNPFDITVTVTASITPSRTLSYQFSNDNGSTWSATQSSDTYTWTGLAEETSYNLKIKVIAAHVGAYAVDTTAQYSLTVSTAADQAKTRIKDNGTWKKGKAWYKTNGEWVKAKKIYIKNNGEWVIGYNYENN